jgi:hypothetical protein
VSRFRLPREGWGREGFLLGLGLPRGEGKRKKAFDFLGEEGCDAEGSRILLGVSAR